jgi:hypothetical protein
MVIQELTEIELKILSKPKMKLIDFLPTKLKTFMSVKWFNTDADETPAHGTYAIIEIDGTYYLTVYDSLTGIFIMNTEPYTEFSSKEKYILWTPFKP